MRSVFLFILAALSLPVLGQLPSFSCSAKPGGECVPAAIKFIDLSDIPGTVVKRIWNFGDDVSAEFSPNETEANHNYIGAGRFYATLTLIMADGSELISTKQPIFIWPKPIAAFDASELEGCQPLNVNFTDASTSAEGAITKWIWDFDNTGSTLQHPSYIFKRTDEFLVSLIVYNEYGCKSDVAATQMINVFDPVQPSFTTDVNGSCNLPVEIKFTNTTNGKGNINYKWNFDAVGTSTEKNTKYTFTTANAYTVSLTANNGSNCGDHSVSKIIYAGTPAITDFSVTPGICAGKSASYSATITPSSLAQNITWSFPDNNTTETGESASHVFYSAGEYNVKVKAISAIGCVSPEASGKTTVENTPVASFSMTAPRDCTQPADVLFTNTSGSTGNNYLYEWNFGDGEASLLENPAHIFLQRTSVPVTFSITDKQTGCTSAPVSRPVDMQQQVMLELKPEGVCKPVILQATATTSSNEMITGYRWDWGDHTTSTTTINTSSHTYLAEGSYDVKVTITTAGGCTITSSTQTLKVSDKCKDDGTTSGGKGEGGFSFANSCSSKNLITFTDNFSNRADNNYKVIAWDFGDNEIATGTNLVTHEYTGEGTREYDVKVTRQNEVDGTIISSIKKLILIDEQPKIKQSRTSTCTKVSINLDADAVHSQYIQLYQWNFGDGSSIKSVANPNFDITNKGHVSKSYSKNADYWVTLKVTDKLGCETSVKSSQIKIKGPDAGFTGDNTSSCKEDVFTRLFVDRSQPNDDVPIVKWNWYIWRTGVELSPPNKSPTISYDNPDKMELTFTNADQLFRQYSVKLIVVDEDGCESSPATESKYIKSYWPKADFTVSKDVLCGNLNAKFSNESTAGVPLYLWNFGDNATSAIKDPLHLYKREAEPGNNKYTVSLSVSEKDMPTCNDVTVKEDFIKIVKLVADFEISDLSGCPPIAVNFTNKSLYADKYSWIFSDGSATSQKDITARIYQMGGEYAVKLSVEGPDGCTNDITKTFEIKGPSGELEYGNREGCVPFDFEMRVTNTKNVNNYAWDFGDGKSSTDPANSTQHHTYTIGKEYFPNVIISDGEGCNIPLIAPTVKVNNATVPTFNEMPAICTGSSAPVLPATSTNGITGTWNPATVDNTTTGEYTFTPDANQCAANTSLTVEVNNRIISIFDEVPAICSGSLAPVLSATSNNGITGTWIPAIVDNTTTGEYTFTPDANQCATNTSLTVEVNNRIIPIFAEVPAICSGSTVPVLLTTSTNGITGTWSPAIVDNTTTGEYTFTPDANQCTTNTSLTVEVNNRIIPIFAEVPAICSGSLAPVLSATSNNGITGTWSSATVDNTTTGEYTFTPDANQCATTKTLAVIVNNSIIPTFNEVSAICSGSLAPVLSTTSNNSITGTWSPAIVDNTTTGEYTFTPDEDQCATSATITVTVNDEVIPIFADIPIICKGSTAPELPRISTNGITGTWTPATVSNTENGTYIFTPNEGQCATSATITITVNDPTIPIFADIPAICKGNTAPELPMTSINGITGTWSPATVNNTENGTYVFTPDESQCATSATITVTVNDEVIPVFADIPTICKGNTAPELPRISTNGIAGTWSPATVSNNASGTYTFTPDESQCATSATITVTVNDEVIPIFANIPTICNGSVAPVLSPISTNGITGTWSPATVNNMITGTYVFTANEDQCATLATTSVIVNDPIIPIFADIPAICKRSIAPILPARSTNGITGTWSPATCSNMATGTYAFTPDEGQCATSATITVTVNDEVIPVFADIPAICKGSTAPELTRISTNGITGTWSPATVSNNASETYTFTPDEGQCATSATIMVTVNDEVIPVFADIPAICKGSTAPELPRISTNEITGTWSPATVSNFASDTYIFTPDESQCATSATITVIVNDEVIPVFADIPAICKGSVAPVLSPISTNGIAGTWSRATVNNTENGTYVFTPDESQCATSATITVTVNDEVIPVFADIPTICKGNTAPELPRISTNGIVGTWSPATVNNTENGTYIFTPDEDQCTASATITITVTDPIIPIFADIPAICKGNTAPELPMTSINGITGTWSPATVSNNASGTYTFTPDEDQCAASATITITVTDPIVPTFAEIPAICKGSTAPELTRISTNGIVGTWSPATVNNTENGTYVFTPDEGQCTASATITITVTDPIIPTFTKISAICKGSTAPELPRLSTNGITGTWSPATVNNTENGTYVFTPDEDQCATSATITVMVNDEVIPTFAEIPAICKGSTAPELSRISTNRITGTWSPAIVNNTENRTYVFSPDEGQCATLATITVTVNDEVIPVFADIPAICKGSTAPELSRISTNGITGTWSPATGSNMATGTYAFTPDEGQCATSATITVTVNDEVIPVFADIPAICKGSTAPELPRISTNGITGTWSPAIVNNMATGTYAFRPDEGQCAASATITITVTDPIVPTFAEIPAICKGSIAPILPSTSINGITGTWNPTNISNTASGTYTFSPDEGQCATSATITITVNDEVIPTFAGIPALCQGSVAPILLSTSINGITGTWSPATVNNTENGTYTFTPDEGQCATSATIMVTVNDEVIPIFADIPAICKGSIAPTLPSTSINGIGGTWNPATVNNTENGTYAFTPDEGQCATSTVKSVIINDPIIPTFTELSPICKGGTASELPAISINGITGSWSPATINNTESGTYTFTPNSNQCAATTVLPISVYDYPSLTISGPPEACINEDVSFSVTISSRDPVAASSWKINNITKTGQLNSVSETFVSEGNKTLQYVAKTIHGCESTASKDVLVHPLPALKAMPTTIVCKGSNVQLMASGADKYTWSAKGNTLTDALYIKAMVTTMYYVDATNIYNCLAKDSVLVKVDDPVNIKVSDPISICSGTSIGLWVKGNAGSFRWNSNPGLSNLYISNPTASPSVTAKYSVTGYSSNTCPDETSSVLVTVTPVPTVNLGPDITVPAGSTILLHANTAGNIADYNWQPSAGLSCANCSNTSLIATKDVSYTLKVSTPEGCSASDTIRIHVLCNQGAVQMPAAFTPNGDGKNDVFYVMGNGIKRVKSFKIFDRWGRMVFRKENCIPNDSSAGWNGLIDGRPVSQTSTFIYIVDAICVEEKEIQLKGTVLLMR